MLITTYIVNRGSLWMVEINLDMRGNLLPHKNGKIALIDADTAIFAACCVIEQDMPVCEEDYTTKEEWLEVFNSPNFSDGILYTTCIDEVKRAADDKIQDIVERSGCTGYELHFTGGRKSFRYDIYPKYKANRLGGRAPLGLREVKKLFLKEGAEIHYDWEADDAVIAKMRAYPDKYVLCAVDKDILYSLEGKHFNYYQNSNKQMHYFEVDAHTAMLHHYKQTLTGDGSDNVPGLHRVGPKTADKILADITTEKEAWDTIGAAYENRGKDILDALLTMRLVNTHQVTYNTETKKYGLKLWRPPV